MTDKQWVRAINRLGKSSWLIVKAALSDIDPYRDEAGRPFNPGCWPKDFVPKPMRRLMFQVDGFTQADFEIMGDGTLRANFVRDNPEPMNLEERTLSSLQSGDRLTWMGLAKLVGRYCRASNDRVRFPLMVNERFATIRQLL